MPGRSQSRVNEGPGGFKHGLGRAGHLEVSSRFRRFRDAIAKRLSAGDAGSPALNGADASDELSRHAAAVAAALSPSDREAPIDFRGVRMIVAKSGNYTEQSLVDGVENEKREFDAFVELVAGKRVHFADLGANAGVYTLLCAANAAADSRIIAIEPNPEMYRRLKRNLAINGFFDVEVREIAIGESEGFADFYIRENLGQSGLIRDVFDHVGVRKVRLETIVQFYQETGRDFDLSILKIDIEGAEYDALAPLLENRSGAVFLPDYILFEHAHAEAWPTPPERFFGDCGYETFRRFRKNTIVRLKPSSDEA